MVTTEIRKMLIEVRSKKKVGTYANEKKNSLNITFQKYFKLKIKVISIVSKVLLYLFTKKYKYFYNFLLFLFTKYFFRVCQHISYGSYCNTFIMLYFQSFLRIVLWLQ